MQNFINMSRIGKLPVQLPEGVEIKVEGNLVKVKGAKGQLEKNLPETIKVKVEDGQVSIASDGKGKNSKALWGTYRSHLANMVHGVSEGWEKKLEMVGTGYRAKLDGKDLELTVGFSHPVEVKVPEGITFSVEKTIITVAGVDKELVGQVAARIRSIRPPEPYKGKGIRYVDEEVRRKPGKAAKTEGVES